MPLRDGYELVCTRLRVDRSVSHIWVSAYPKIQFRSTLYGRGKRKACRVPGITYGSYDDAVTITRFGVSELFSFLCLAAALPCALSSLAARMSFGAVVLSCLMCVAINA